MGRSDPHAQAHPVLGVIGKALEEAGAALADLVRTRIFVSDIDRWQEIARFHHEIFAAIRPACTMVEVNRPITTRRMVEIGADAIIADRHEPF